MQRTSYFEQMTQQPPADVIPLRPPAARLRRWEVMAQDPAPTALRVASRTNATLEGSAARLSPIGMVEPQAEGAAPQPVYAVPISVDPSARVVDRKLPALTPPRLQPDRPSVAPVTTQPSRQGPLDGVTMPRPISSLPSSGSAPPSPGALKQGASTSLRNSHLGAREELTIPMVLQPQSLAPAPSVLPTTASRTPTVQIGTLEIVVTPPPPPPPPPQPQVAPMRQPASAPATPGGWPRGFLAGFGLRQG